MIEPSESTQMTSVPAWPWPLVSGAERGDRTGDGQDDVRALGDERVGVGLAGARASKGVPPVKMPFCLALSQPSSWTVLPLSSLYLAMPSAKPSMKIGHGRDGRPP